MRYEHKEFREIRVPHPSSWTGVTFEDCNFHRVHIAFEVRELLKHGRPEICDVQILNSRADHARVGPVVARQCTVDSLTTGKFDCQFIGTLFDECAIRGDCGVIVIQGPDPHTYSQEVIAMSHRQMESFYSSVECAIDISEAIFQHCVIRDMPADLVRIDNENQVLVDVRRVGSLLDTTRNERDESIWKQIAGHYFGWKRSDKALLISNPESEQHKTFLTIRDALSDLGCIIHSEV